MNMFVYESKKTYTTTHRLHSSDVLDSSLAVAAPSCRISTLESDDHDCTHTTAAGHYRWLTVKPDLYIKTQRPPTLLFTRKASNDPIASIHKVYRNIIQQQQLCTGCYECQIYKLS